MVGYKDLDAVAANNTAAPPNGAPEGMDAAAVNNIQRQQMANHKNDTVYRVPLLVDLKALDSTKQLTGSGITLSGLTVVGEGGGVFYYDSASSATADNVDIIEPDDSIGRWIRAEGQFPELNVTGNQVFVNSDTPVADVTNISIKFELNSGDQAGQIRAVADKDYAITASKDSLLEFYTSDNNVDILALVINQAQNSIFMGDINLESNETVVADVTNKSLSATFNGTDLGGRVEFIPNKDYTTAANKDSTLNFYTTNDGVEFLAITTNHLGNTAITGALSKGSGTWEAWHPFLKNTRICHSFIEGARCDNLYRGTAKFINGKAFVNLDKDSSVNGMTEGTFVKINKDIVLSSLIVENSFNRAKGHINGNILYIECEDNHSSESVHWGVTATRNDEAILRSTITDNNGNLILEFPKNLTKE